MSAIDECAEAFDSLPNKKSFPTFANLLSNHKKKIVVYVLKRTNCQSVLKLPLLISSGQASKINSTFRTVFLKRKSRNPSNHVTRQQKVRNAFLDRVLVLAAAAHQLATLHARLHQKRVQVLESLRRLVVVRHQNLGFRRLFW